MARKKLTFEEGMQELYRVEHFGLWLMYGLLCAAVLLQMLLGAEMRQMAGEIAVLIISSIAMVIANIRHGIWDTDARPSVKGNAVYSAGSGVCVLVVLAIVSGNIPAALFAGLGAAVLCFAALTISMRYMQKRQARQWWVSLISQELWGEMLWTPPAFP